MVFHAYTSSWKPLLPQEARPSMTPAEAEAFKPYLDSFKDHMKTFAALLPAQRNHGIPREEAAVCIQRGFDLILNDPLNHTIRAENEYRDRLYRLSGVSLSDGANLWLFHETLAYARKQVTENNIEKLNFLGSAYKPPILAPR